MGKIFGGGSSSKSTNESYNKAYGDISAATVPALDNIQTGGNNMAKLLGGDTTFLDRFKAGMGFDWELGEGAHKIAAQNLSRGLGDSGATLKALARFQTGLNNQYADKFLTANNDFANLGINAGNLLANAGQYSKGKQTSSSSGGLGSFIGSAAGAIAASDRRLKKNIERISTLKDGLGVYSYSYIWDDEPQIGVMAQEVEKLRPWALGPEVLGYKTVNYGAL